MTPPGRLLTSRYVGDAFGGVLCCLSEFWKYLSCVSMVVIFRFFFMRFLAMEGGRNVDSPY